jgi:hypothetical protein
MVARSSLKAFGASNGPGCQPLLTPAPQRLCNFWNSTSNPRLYSNQRTESVLLNDTVTSDSSPPTKTRKEALDRQRQVERNRRWLARKLEVDPGYRARLSQRKQA